MGSSLCNCDNKDLTEKEFKSYMSNNKEYEILPNGKQMNLASLSIDINLLNNEEKKENQLSRAQSLSVEAGNEEEVKNNDVNDLNDLNDHSAHTDQNVFDDILISNTSKSKQVDSPVKFKDNNISLVDKPVTTSKLDFNKLKSNKASAKSLRSYKTDKSFNEYTYEGEFVDGKRHGKGKLYLTQNNKLIYEGEFFNGYKEGSGVEYNEDGSEYTGNFQKNKRHGIGILKNANGSVYEGNFNQGSIQGNGKLTWSSTKYYEGEFINGHLNGYGKYVSKDTIYRGYYRNDQKNGLGHICYTEKKLHILGFFKNDIMEGYGLIITEDIRGELSEKMVFVTEGKNKLVDLDTTRDEYKKLRIFFNTYRPKSVNDSTHHGSIKSNITFQRLSNKAEK